MPEPPSHERAAPSRRLLFVLAPAAVGVALALVDGIPRAAAARCLEPVDLAWLVQTLRPSLLAARPLHVLELAALFPVAGLSASAWAWTLAALLALVAALVAVAARALGLERGWAAAAGLVFLGSGALAEALAVRFSLELFLSAAWLLLAAAYARRARAVSWRARAGWLALEVVAIALGLGNKESMAAYPLAILALELGGTLPRAGTRGERRRALAARLAPHAVLAPLAAAYALRGLAGASVEHALSFAPASLGRQLSGLFAAVGAPWLVPWVGPAIAGALVLAAIALALWRLRDAPARTLLLLALAGAAPVLVFPNRLFAGYVVLPWAFLAAGAVAAVRAARSRAAAGAILGGLAVLLVLPAEGLFPPDTCFVDRALVERVAAQVDCTGAPGSVAAQAWADTWLHWRETAVRLPAAPRTSCAALDEPVAARACLERERAAEPPGAETFNPIGHLEQLWRLRCGRPDSRPGGDGVR